MFPVEIVHLELTHIYNLKYRNIFFAIFGHNFNIIFFFSLRELKFSFRRRRRRRQKGSQEATG